MFRKIEKSSVLKLITAAVLIPSLLFFLVWWDNINPGFLVVRSLDETMSQALNRWMPSPLSQPTPFPKSEIRSWMEWIRYYFISVLPCMIGAFYLWNIFYQKKEGQGGKSIRQKMGLILLLSFPLGKFLNSIIYRMYPLFVILDQKDYEVASVARQHISDLNNGFFRCSIVVFVVISYIAIYIVLKKHYIPREFEL